MRSRYSDESVLEAGSLSVIPQDYSRTGISKDMYRDSFKKAKAVRISISSRVYRTKNLTM